MKLFSIRIGHASVLALALGVSACASRADSEAASPAQAALTETAPETGHMHFVREALSKVNLRPDQKTQVDQMVADAQARHASIKQAHQALAGALADQVQAGTIDRAALQPKIDALTAAIEQSRPQDQAALARLHDLLDPAQRNQFVDAVESQFHGGEHHEKRGMMMRKWAQDLNLTDQQRDQIHAALRAKFQGEGGKDGMREHWREARENGRRWLESFRQDQFNPTLPVGQAKIGHGIGKIVDVAEAAVPILTPEQRAIAAQKLRTSPVGGQ
jgi:Spy/CpxP family protein refolding chaperone